MGSYPNVSCHPLRNNNLPSAGRSERELLSRSEDRTQPDPRDGGVHMERRRHLSGGPIPVGGGQYGWSQGRRCIRERFNTCFNESSRQQEPADGLVRLPFPPLPIVAPRTGGEIFLTAHDPSPLVVEAVVEQWMGLEGFTEKLRVEQAVASFMSQCGPNSTLANWTIVEE